jgi:16S rRNA (guanine527-N7)-methyltransferase
MWARPTTTEQADLRRAGIEARLLPVLEEARRLGFVGPGSLMPHVGHALGFAEAVRAGGLPGSAGPGRCLDLGSGGGLPGLALALWWPDSLWVLLDAGARRTAFLRDAVEKLGLGGRTEVVTGRAEERGHDADLRGAMDLVAARGFGPPAVTAECAAPFVAVGGVTVVSEPPGGRPERWPAAGLALVGMVPGPTVTCGDGTYQVLEQRFPCPAPLPRRIGIPAKRPLFAPD